MHLRRKLYLAACLLPLTVLNAANTAIVIEAESGELGDDWLVQSDGGTQFITIADNGPTFARPGNMDRVASYEVEFAAPGEYAIYARVRVGADGFDADSLFLPMDFGEMDPEVNGDWINVNNFANAVGYNQPSQWVVNGGLLGSQVWKWVRVSGFDGAADQLYVVEEGSLTQTFRIGGREDGFEIDKIAFARSDLFFTVEALESGLPGTTEDPFGDPFIPTGPPLATGHTKFLGSAYSNTQAPYFELYFNQIVSENDSKWGSIESQRDVMNWSGADEAYNLARAHGMPFRWHVLVWGNQQPTWMKDLSPEEQLEEIHEWFAAVAERYPDVDYVEVVNEPLHQPPTDRASDPTSGGYFDALGGSGETGWDWVVNAFRIAREYFPDTPLMINDYGILSNTQTARRYREIIELLQEEDLIDMIGVQGHAFSTRVPVSTMTAVLDILGETGLPIQVTEMDIDGSTDEIQLADYERVFPALWEHPSVMGITLWGWRIGMWRTDQGAYLINDNGTERPAMEWLREYLAETATGDPSEQYLWGYPVVSDWIDTGTWLGFAYVKEAPWIYQLNIGWVWVVEESHTASGAWMYAPK